MIIDLLLLVFLGFVVFSIVQYVSRPGGGRERSKTSDDSLRQTQDLSRQTALFSGMSPAQEVQYRDSMSIGVCFARFAMQVAAADGHFTQAEFLSILQFFKSAHPSYVGHIQGVLLQDMANPESVDWDYNLSEAQRILAKPQWQGFDSILFEGLLRISKANSGRVGDRELGVLFAIMASLGWTTERTESWFHSSRQRSSSSRPNSPGPDSLAEAAQILGVTVGDDFEAIKKRYRQLVRENHPDRYAHMGDEMQKSATARFQSIQSAYEILEAHHRR